MKNKIKNLLTVFILTLVPVITSFAQPTPAAPGPGSVPTGADPTLGCNVPIGNGYWLLLALAVCYGIYQVWQMRKVAKIA